MSNQLNDLMQLVIRTESHTPDLVGQEAQLQSALELVTIACEILDQVKRKIYYGEKGEYNASKLNSAAERLARIDAFDFTADEFINKAAKTPVIVNTRLVHGIIGSLTEAAEMGEALLHCLETGEFDNINLIEELADCAWYSAIMQDELKVPHELLYHLLIAKLSARYGDKFSDVSATVRDLGTEREVMERFIKSTTETE